MYYFVCIVCNPVNAWTQYDGSVQYDYGLVC